jgi:hypothetical protein
MQLDPSDQVPPTDARTTVERRARVRVLEGSEVGQAADAVAGKLESPLDVLLAKRRRRRNGLGDTRSLRGVLDQDGAGSLRRSGNSNIDRVSSADLGSGHARRNTTKVVEGYDT